MGYFEIVLISSLTLFFMFMLGWASCWFILRIVHGSGGDQKLMRELNNSVIIAEAARDQAVQRLRDRELELSSQLDDGSQKYLALLNELRSARDTIYSLEGQLQQLKHN